MQIGRPVGSSAAWAIAAGSASSRVSGRPRGGSYGLYGDVGRLDCGSQSEATASFLFNLTKGAGDASGAYTYKVLDITDPTTPVFASTNDFTVNSGTLDTSPWNTTSDTLTLTAVHDGVVEGNHTYAVWFYRPGETGAFYQSPSITIVDDDQGPPTFTTTALSAAENGTAVGTVVASGAGTTYSIPGGISADDAKFSITSAGVLTFLAPHDYESPNDVGADNVYDVTVRADTNGATTDQVIHVTVTDVDEAHPVITSNGGGATATATIDENTTAVFASQTATDADTGETITWSISGGADASKFTIDAGTGALSFVSAQNYESPTGSANSGHDYVVQVQASSGTLTDTQDVTVTVANVAEAPTITNNGGAPTVILHVNENTTAVTTLTATDNDAGQTISYGIVATGDSGLFSIDGTTHAVTFTAAPDYETPGDANGDNVYDLTLKATDAPSGQIATQHFLVIVDNVVEAGDGSSNNGFTNLGGGGSGTSGGGTGGTGGTGGAGGSTTLPSSGDDNLAIPDGTNGLVGGGDGNDTITGGTGADSVDGDNGSDSLVGAAGDDFIRGLNDDDVVRGGDGNDTVNGNLGNDSVTGDAGDDQVYGGQGADTVFAGDGNDLTNGNIGDDIVHGDDGNDSVYGGQGADVVYGDNGNDWISGDLGDDVLNGGAGADVFVFGPGKGHDWIVDFNAAEGDRIALPTGTSYTIDTVSGQTVITLSTGDTIGLVGATGAGFTSANIIFV